MKNNYAELNSDVRQFIKLIIQKETSDSVCPMKLSPVIKQTEKYDNDKNVILFFSFG